MILILLFMEFCSHRLAQLSSSVKYIFHNQQKIYDMYHTDLFMTRYTVAVLFRTHTDTLAPVACLKGLQYI